jgi:hypothetical protein
LNEKKYTDDGFLVVSESHTCPLWEKDSKPCRSGWTHDCFFCKFADFRSEEVIRRAEEKKKSFAVKTRSMKTKAKHVIAVTGRTRVPRGKSV